MEVSQGLQKLEYQSRHLSICHSCLVDQVLQYSSSLHSGGLSNLPAKYTWSQADSQFKGECSLVVINDTSKAACDVGVIEVERSAQFMFKSFLTNFMSHNLHSMTGTCPLVLGLVNFAEPTPAHRKMSGYKFVSM